MIRIAWLAVALCLGCDPETGKDTSSGDGGPPVDVDKAAVAPAAGGCVCVAFRLCGDCTAAAECRGYPEVGGRKGGRAVGTMLLDALGDRPRSVDVRRDDEEDEQTES